LSEIWPNIGKSENPSAGLTAELLLQPQAGEIPVVADISEGDAESLGRLLERATQKEAEIHYRSGAGVDLLQIVEERRDLDQPDRVGEACSSVENRFGAGCRSLPFLGLTAARIFDQHLAHGAGRE